MEELNKKFVKGNVLKAAELNEVVGKINELIGANYATVDDVKELISSIGGPGGEITIPIESEFGDSLFKAISQRFFTDEVKKLNAEIEDAKNQDINLLTFDVEDGCLMMNQPSDNSNVDFSISEEGNLLFDIKV
jgi:hypothetical protein|nr:hypothetical protein [Bacteroides intestinalis]